MISRHDIGIGCIGKWKDKKRKKKKRKKTEWTASRRNDWSSIIKATEKMHYSKFGRS